MKDKTSRLTVKNLNLTNREMHGNAALKGNQMLILHQQWLISASVKVLN